MKIILEKDDSTTEEIKHFILIACNVDHPPFIVRRISNIDKFYVPYILGDHSRWEFKKQNNNYIPEPIKITLEEITRNKIEQLESENQNLHKKVDNLSSKLDAWLTLAKTEVIKSIEHNNQRILASLKEEQDEHSS